MDPERFILFRRAEDDDNEIEGGIRMSFKDEKDLSASLIEALKKASAEMNVSVEEVFRNQRKAAPPRRAPGNAPKAPLPKK